jgi:hypothetical protein
MTLVLNLADFSLLAKIWRLRRVLLWSCLLWSCLLRCC